MFRLVTVLISVVILLFARQIPSREPGEPAGACCLPNANCLKLIEEACALIDGTSWAGPDTDCTDVDEIGIADACETLDEPKLYWFNGGPLDPVKRSNLDGSNVETVFLPGLSLDSSLPLNVIVDRPGNKIYFASGSRITTLKLFGEGRDTLVDVSRVITGLAIDFSERKIYWSERAPAEGGVWGADLDVVPEDPRNRQDVERLSDDTNTLAILLVSPASLCRDIAADANHDSDIDLRDFAVFQNCFSGPAK